MYIDQVLLYGYERAGDEVNVIGNAEGDVGLVLFGQIYLLHMLAREAHGLPVGEFTAGQNLCGDAGSVSGEDLKLKQGIVEQDAVAGCQFIGKVLIADGDHVLITNDFFGGEDEGIAVIQIDLSFLEGSDTEFRSFGIKHDRDRKIEFLPDFLNTVDSCKMFFVCAV